MYACFINQWKFFKTAIVLILLSNFTVAYAGDWDDQISMYLKAYEISAEKPKPIAYPKLGERVKNVFLLHKTNHILIQHQQISQLKTRTELFYTEGELHILEHGDGWNMVTKGDFVYEWKNGSKTGIKIKRNEKNLVDYILYLTDPSYIMTSLYNTYSRYPERVDVLEKEGEPWKEVSFKKPRYGFETLYVNQTSLWFHGFGGTNTRTGEKFGAFYSMPLEYKLLPKALLEKMKHIRFQDSNLSVRRHMTYL